MRFVIYGAGAVGGTLGGLLALAGHPVVLIARGEHLEVIQSGGLRLITPDRDVTVKLPAVAGPAEVDWQPGDVVMLTTKSQDTSAALHALAGCADAGTPVICVQNGVANEAMALRRFANVYGVCVMFPATHLQPGVVVGHSAPVAGLLDVGRYPTGADSVAAQLTVAFGEARVGSLVRTDIMRWKYAKLLINLGNAIQALCGSGEETDVLAAMAREEGRGALAAAGIPYASAQEDAERRGNHITYAPAGGQQRTGGSSWQSLARAAGAVEADYLNGEVVLLGRVHGVATPVNELARQLVNRWATQRRPPGSLTVAQFRALLVDA